MKYIILNIELVGFGGVEDHLILDEPCDREFIIKGSPTNNMFVIDDESFYDSHITQKTVATIIPGTKEEDYPSIVKEYNNQYQQNQIDIMMRM